MACADARGCATACTSGWAQISGASNLGEMMDDLIYLAVTVIFFLLAFVYVRGCEKLQ